MSELLEFPGLRRQHSRNESSKVTACSCARESVLRGELVPRLEREAHIDLQEQSVVAGEFARERRSNLIALCTVESHQAFANQLRRSCGAVRIQCVTHRGDDRVHVVTLGYEAVDAFDQWHGGVDGRKKRPDRSLLAGRNLGVDGFDIVEVLKHRAQRNSRTLRDCAGACISVAFAQQVVERIGNGRACPCTARGAPIDPFGCDAVRRCGR